MTGGEQPFSQAEIEAEKQLNKAFEDPIEPGEEADLPEGLKEQIHDEIKKQWPARPRPKSEGHSA